MREIEPTAKFKRDFRRETKSDSKVAPLVAEVLELLVSDSVLPARLRDHALAGDWKGFRDCHVKPDLVLIYKKVGDNLLKLVRFGSHSAIFG
jgi:mRNA interferase YafQ